VIVSSLFVPLDALEINHTNDPAGMVASLKVVFVVPVVDVTATLVPNNSLGDPLDLSVE
jgi:hypothetical protein